MTNKHTPGPWDNNAPHEQTIKAKGKDVATVYCSNKDWQANARLIAASPDLLEALEQLLKCPDAQSEQWAREAIAKAKHLDK